ncbi:hypothetical protein TEA_019913 [Camellia sinensis var. sinensis]|uniref:Cyanobacterial aminoacyl-tRNA synthetase CAAD domain-containing protein n=1 Tax=Camellia sinensis var. sinensis TaxID=542762 RepID=A0A4S4F0Y1_CAMSN|nr:hypothetical protein TEA_019913 [Camellia sinensis var. sinensis]
MASIVANLPSPLTTSPKFTVSATEERQSRVAIVVKATGTTFGYHLSSDVASHGTLTTSGFSLFQWFIYRYLLFKPDREELLQTVKKSVSDILGHNEKSMQQLHNGNIQLSVVYLVNNTELKLMLFA